MQTCRMHWWALAAALVACSKSDPAPPTPEPSTIAITATPTATPTPAPSSTPTPTPSSTPTPTPTPSSPPTPAPGPPPTPSSPPAPTPSTTPTPTLTPSSTSAPKPPPTAKAALAPTALAPTALAPSATPSAAPALPPLKPAATRLSGKNFTLDAASPGCRVDVPCAVTLRLAASGEYHVNKEYPYKFTATPAPGVQFLGTADANVFTRAAGDFREDGEKAATMTVRFKPTAAGEARISGTYKMSVCSAENCQIEAQPVSLAVPVL